MGYSNRAKHVVFVPGERMALGVLVAGLLLIYFGLFNYDFTVDGLRYAAEVDAGGPLFHPNHLLPNALFYAIKSGVVALGIKLTHSIWLIQCVNILAGVATAGFLCRALAAESGPLVAALLAALYAFGFVAWNFAEEPEVYVLPAVCVAASLALLLRAPTLRWVHIVLLALLATLAVLFLQQYVFWYAALLVLLWRAEMGYSHLSKWIFVAIGVPLLCLVTYVIVGFYLGMLADSSHILSWFLGYAYDLHSGFGTYRPAPAWSERVLASLLGLGNLVFAYEILGSSTMFILALVTAALFIALLAIALFGCYRAMSTARFTAGVMFGWVLVNALFAMWWEARDIEFLYPVWLGTIILMGLGGRRIQPAVLGLVVFLICYINLDVSFWPQRDWPERYQKLKNLAVAEHLEPRDVVITEELNTVRYLAYFQGVGVQFMPGGVSAAMHTSESVAQARAALDQALAQKQRIYTTELDEHGRLYRIAQRFSMLGRAGFEGAIDNDINELYRGLVLEPTAVSGVRRVLVAPLP